MAGTGLGHISDSDAAFLNPALVGGGYRNQPGLRSLSFPGLSAEATPGSLDFAGDVLREKYGAAGLGSTLRGLDADSDIHFREQMFPNVVIGRLLFGVLQGATLDVHGYRKDDRTQAASTNKATEALVYGRTELAGVFGFSVPMGKRALLGATARYGLRTQIRGLANLADDQVSEAADAIEKSNIVQRGFAVDAGLHIMPWPLAGLSLALVGRNLGRDRYEPKAGPWVGLPSTSDTTDVDAGITWAPLLRKAAISPALALEMHGILRPDLEPQDKASLGLEVAFGSSGSLAPITLRAGHTLWGPSFGFSLDLQLFRLEAASYTQAVHLDHETRTETRYIVRTSWDFLADKNSP